MGHFLCFGIYHSLLLYIKTQESKAKRGILGRGGLMTLTKCNTMYTTYYEGGTIYADDRNRNIQDDTGA